MEVFLRRYWTLYSIVIWVGIITLGLSIVGKAEIVALYPYKLYARSDHVFKFLSALHVLMAAIVIEAVVLLSIIKNWKRNPPIAGRILLGISAVFVGYRLGLRWEGVETPCNCFGQIGDIMLRGAGTLNDWAIVLLGVMLLGGGLSSFLMPPAETWRRSSRG